MNRTPYTSLIVRILFSSFRHLQLPESLLWVFGRRRGNYVGNLWKTCSVRYFKHCSCFGHL